MPIRRRTSGMQYSHCKVAPKVSETGDWFDSLVGYVNRRGCWFRACSAPLLSPMKCAAPLWQLLSQTLWGQMDCLRCRMWTVLRRRRCRLDRWTSFDRQQWHLPRSIATLSNRWRDRKSLEQGETYTPARQRTTCRVEGVWQLFADLHTSSCESLKILHELNEKRRSNHLQPMLFIGLRCHGRMLTVSMKALRSGLPNSRCSSVRRLIVVCISCGLWSSDRLSTNPAQQIFSRFPGENLGTLQ